MAGEAIELLLLPSKMAVPFARALADAAGRAVRMRDPQTLPYTHPFHYCVRWLNVDRLPVCRFPRGAILSSINGAPALIELAAISHFAPIDGYVRATPLTPLFVPAPALGSFLI